MRRVPFLWQDARQDPVALGVRSAAMQDAGFTFASLMALGPQLAVDTARQAEALGYRSFWTAETTGPEAFTTLAVAGAAAPSLGLGTGVIPLQIRTPMTVAMAAATLQALQPERDVWVGIGISSPVVTERWHGVDYGDRPLARCREYVTLLKEIWAGDAVTFDGDFYRLSRSRLGVRLGGLGVPLDRRNIWEDPDAAAVVRSIANGNETVPTVVIGEMGMVNPSVDRVLQAIEAEAPHLAPTG